MFVCLLGFYFVGCFLGDFGCGFFWGEGGGGLLGFFMKIFLVGIG